MKEIIVAFEFTENGQRKRMVGCHTVGSYSKREQMAVVRECVAGKQDVKMITVERYSDARLEELTK